MTVCVYCSSSDGLAQSLTTAAHEVAALLSSGGHDLVYGGASVGLMGLVARSMLAAGRQVTGVVPSFMQNRGIVLEGITQLVVTGNMRERKARMEDLADAFLALPGGLGTCEELLEVLTLKQLGLTNKPVVILNTDGHYDSLFRFLETIIARNFAGASLRSLFTVAETPAEVLPMLTVEQRDPVPDKWNETSHR